jgi:hypothetical protein
MGEPDMVAGLLITAIAGIIFWLVFFKFKWIRLTYGWGLFVLFFVAHLILIFLIGMRFVAPYTTDAKVIQHTIQLTGGAKRAHQEGPAAVSVRPPSI